MKSNASPSATLRATHHRRSLWQRMVTTTVVLSIVLLIAGGFMAYQSIRLQRYTERHATVLNIEAVAARSVLHSYYLVINLQSSYISQNPTYMRQRVFPYQYDLQADLKELKNVVNETPEEEMRSLTEETIAEINNVLTITEGVLSQAEIGNWPSANVRLATLHQQETILLATLDKLIQATSKYHQSEQPPFSGRLKFATFLPIAVTLLGIALLISGAFTARRWILGPIIALENQVQKFAEGDFSIRLPVDRDDEIGALAHTFNLMADRIQESYVTMAERIEERTRALQKRTAQLQAATEIGRAVSTLSKLEDTLTRAALLISQRYDFYHVGIFLANTAGDAAILQAAYTRNGNAAEVLLKRGLTIPATSANVVGQTLASGQFHTAQFAAEKYPIAELHSTRGEIAIPLKHGDEILGVLDIHSDTNDTFTPEDITALQAVADLLAIAIANTRLFQETQTALETARRAYDQLTRAGWQRFIHLREVLGFRLDETGEVYPIAKQPTEPVPPAQKQAAPTAPTVTQDENTLKLPVQARGHTIAMAYLRKNTPWTEREKRLVTRLSERLGSLLESARLFAESQRRAAQLQIASEIARDASGTLNVQELLNKAVNLVRERFNFYHASVFLLDESGQYAYVEESTGEAGRQLKARRHRLAVGSASIVGQTLATKEPVVVNDVTKSDIHHFNPLLPQTRSELGIPLKVGDEVIGALDVQSTSTQAFSDEDVQVLQILADQLAIAIINARLFQETQQHLAEHQTLHQITTAAASALSVEEAIRNVVESIHALRPDEGVLFLVPTEESPNMLRVAAWAGHTPPDPEALKNLRLPVGSGVIGRAAATLDTIVEDIRSAPNEILGTTNMRSELATPLVYRGELIGVLDLTSPKPNAYDEHDKVMQRTLANSLAAIIANIRLLEAVRRHSGELELLYEITAIAASHVDLDILLNDITSRLQAGFNAQHCGIILANPDGKTGILAASADAPGAPGSGMVGIEVPLTAPFFQEAIRTQKVVLVNDVDDEEKVGEARELLKKRGTKQLLAAPLLVRNEVIGMLAMNFPELRHKIGSDETRILEQIARQVSSAIEVARLFQQAVQTAERERLVTEITTKIRASNDPQTILQTAIEELRRALRAETTQIMFVDEPEQM